MPFSREKNEGQDKPGSGDTNASFFSGRDNEPAAKDVMTFNLIVDAVPYIIKARPFSLNDEVRFYVNVNGGTDHVFTWDSELGRLRAIDDQSSIMPDALEEAISAKLESKQR